MRTRALKMIKKKKNKETKKNTATKTKTNAKKLVSRYALCFR